MLGDGRMAPKSASERNVSQVQHESMLLSQCYQNLLNQCESWRLRIPQAPARVQSWHWREQVTMLPCCEHAPDVRGDELVWPLQLDADLEDLAVPQKLDLRLRTHHRKRQRASMCVVGTIRTAQLHQAARAGQQQTSTLAACTGSHILAGSPAHITGIPGMAALNEPVRRCHDYIAFCTDHDPGNRRRAGLARPRGSAFR